MILPELKISIYSQDIQYQEGIKMSVFPVFQLRDIHSREENKPNKY